MTLHPDEIYHVYNRGNNRQPIFFERENYYYFLRKVKQNLSPNCNILAYTLMPNHFHFMVCANDQSNKIFRRSVQYQNVKEKKQAIKLTLFSRGLQRLLSSYARGINVRFERTGSLFQQNTKWKKTSSEFLMDDYSIWAFIYIHNNPKAAGLVKSPEDYEFTSYRDFLENKSNSLCNIPLAKKMLYLDENEIFNARSIIVPPDVVKNILKGF